MLERIEKIRAEAAAAIEAPRAAPSWRSCGFGYLGRKAELTTILRGIAELPQDERGPGRRCRQPRSQGAGGAAGGARREPRRLRAGGEAGRGPDRRHPARRAAAASRPPAPDRPHHAADRGHDGRPRLPRRRRAGDRARLLQLHRAEPSARPPGADAPGHLLRAVAPRRAAAHPHLADAGALDGDAAAADLRRRPRQGLPARLRRHPQPDVPPGRGPGDRRGDHPRRPAGDAAGDVPGAVRRRARAAPAAALLPLHRAQRRGRRLLLPVRRQRRAGRRRALQPLQGPGLDRDPRRRHGRPQRARLRRARTATTPSGSRASPSGSGSSGWRCCATACRTCGASSTTTCGCWSSSHESSALLAARVLRPRRRAGRGSPTGW